MIGFRKKHIMENILVPCDFSKPAEEAFKFAVQLAKRASAEVHVLYVIDITFLRGNPSLDSSYAFNLNFIKEMEQEMEDKFARMRDQYTPSMVNVRFKHTISSLTLEIGNYVKANNIDLIVMGTHGEGGAVVGSNVSKVVRHATVPVFSIHTAPGKEIENIVFPVIPDQNQKDLAVEVKKLQRLFHARLHLLYVNTPLFIKPDRSAIEALQKFADGFGLQNYTLNVRADYNAEDGITHFSREINADMIAMGTHSLKGFWHLLIGSITEDVANHLPIPVWTYSLK
jgi:nucleotide-binding universal stress UspA family protein